MGNRNRLLFLAVVGILICSSITIIYLRSRRVETEHINPQTVTPKAFDGAIVAESNKTDTIGEVPTVDVKSSDINIEETTTPKEKIEPIPSGGFKAPGDKVFETFENEKDFLSTKDADFVSWFHNNNDSCRKKMDILAKGVGGLTYSQQTAFAEWYVDYLSNHLFPLSKKRREKKREENQRYMQAFPIGPKTPEIEEARDKLRKEHKAKIKELMKQAREERYSLHRTYGFDFIIQKILDKDQASLFESRLKGTWP